MIGKKKLVVGNLKKRKNNKCLEKKIFHEVRKSLLKGDRSHSPCNECDVDGLLSGNEFAKNGVSSTKKVNTKIKPLFIGFGKQALEYARVMAYYKINSRVSVLEI